MFISEKQWKKVNQQMDFLEKQVKELKEKTVLATRSKRPDPFDMGLWELIPINEAIEKILDYFDLEFKYTPEKTIVVKKESND